MDVSRVDPEEVLVDAQNMEAGDVSADIDEKWLTGTDHGKEDKVLVSIRYVISFCVYLNGDGVTSGYLSRIFIIARGLTVFVDLTCCDESRCFTSSLHSTYTIYLTTPNPHRIRPTKAACAWDKAGQTIKLQSEYSKSVTGAEYNFDEILTGSENKPVYNAVARSHVCAAMDGYNAVIFAYGQTASGKTFTLVSSACLKYFYYLLLLMRIN
jgi:hypothetical protein